MIKVFDTKVFSFMESNKNVKVHIDDLDGEGITGLYKDNCLILINHGYGTGKYCIEDGNHIQYRFDSYYQEEAHKEYLNKLLDKEIVNLETELNDVNELVITLLVSNEETAYLNRL